MLSTTVIRKEQLAKLPALSVAVPVTSVTPIKWLPDWWELAVTTVERQLSMTVQAKVTNAEQPSLLALTVMSAGHVIVGFWLSTTTTLKSQVGETLFELSIASNCTKVVPRGKVEPLGKPARKIKAPLDNCHWKGRSRWSPHCTVQVRC